jgi:hypothetical protein
VDHETVGKKSLELMGKDPETRDPIELERAMHEDYERNVYACVDTHKKIFLGDFYVVVITKQERLMPNVLRNYFAARETCPTPDYDQTVYHYSHEREEVSFLWIIPTRDACIHLKANALVVVPQERELLKFVLDFADGTLYKLAKKLNGETADTDLLEH